MREKESGILAKYEQRSIRERAKRLLREIFTFLDNGVPEGWRAESSHEISELQAAISDILKATRLQTKPRGRSMKVFEAHLNRPIRVVSHLVPHAYWKEDGSEHGHGRIAVFDFEEDSYLRHAAWLLANCLFECYSAIFCKPFTDDVWLVAICPICERLFLKKKSNQVCCSRECGNRHDYQMRIRTKEGEKKNRDKSNNSYKKNREKLKARRAAKAAENKAACLKKRILELCESLGGLPKDAGTYRREREILKTLEREGFPVSDLSGGGIRRIWKESQRGAKVVPKSDGNLK